MTVISRNSSTDAGLNRPAPPPCSPKPLFINQVKSVHSANINLPAGTGEHTKRVNENNLLGSASVQRRSAGVTSDQLAASLKQALNVRAAEVKLASASKAAAEPSSVLLAGEKVDNYVSKNNIQAQRTLLLTSLDIADNSTDMSQLSRFLNLGQDAGKVEAKSCKKPGLFARIGRVLAKVTAWLFCRPTHAHG